MAGGILEFGLDLLSVAQAFVALFVIMDPFSSIPIFVSLTKKHSGEQKHEAAVVAASVATGVFVGFLVFGPFILSVLGVRLESFQIGGGLILLLMSISFALGFKFSKEESAPIEAVIIGVPLLSGPGVMLTSSLLAGSLGFWNVLIAGCLTCASSYFVLRASSGINRLVGNRGLSILSRVMGVLLAALAVEFIRKGFGL